MDKRPLDALMFRTEGNQVVFITPRVTHIEYLRWRGWFLLAREDEIRMADIDDIRRSDERGLGL